jgi:hypothetical protein
VRGSARDAAQRVCDRDDLEGACLQVLDDNLRDVSERCARRRTCPRWTRLGNGVLRELLRTRSSPTSSRSHIANEWSLLPARPFALR